jgi:hypothetical protein
MAMRLLLHAWIFLLVAWQAPGALLSPARAADTQGAALEETAEQRYQLPTVSGNREDFGRAVRAPVDGLVAAAATIHRRLQPWGLELLALLTGISLAWMGLKTALERPPLGTLVGEFLTLSITAGILFALLDRWDSVTGAIVAGAADLSRQVSGNVHGAADAVHGVQRMLDAAFWLWEHAEARIGSMLDPLALLGTLLFKLAIAIALLLCACIYLGIYLMSMILLSIAFALGPVFLPWLLVRPASFLFDGWVRFTLVAALYQVIGIVVVTLVSRMHEPMMAGTGTAIDPASDAFNFYYFAAAFVVSGVSTMLMLQVPSIANALVSGSIATRFAPGAVISAVSLSAVRRQLRV